MLGTLVPRPFDKPRCQRASGEQPELTVTVIGKLALVQGANFRHLNTNSSVMLNVRKEMALVRPGVQIEDLASFVHLDEGNDVRPAVCVHRADMGGHNCCTSDQTVQEVAKHFAIRTSGQCPLLTIINRSGSRVS